MAEPPAPPERTTILPLPQGFIFPEAFNHGMTFGDPRIFTALMNDNTRLRQENDELQAQLRTKNRKLVENSLEISALCTSAEELRKQNDLLVAENERLKTRLQQLEDSVAQLHAVVQDKSEIIMQLQAIVQDKSQTLLRRQLMLFLEQMVVVNAYGSKAAASRAMVKTVKQLRNKKIPYEHILPEDALEQIIFFKDDGTTLAHPDLGPMTEEQVRAILADEDDDESVSARKNVLVDTMFRLQTELGVPFGQLFWK
eukprot:m.78782 g.78782  ORF g.78782 m.78782 type:complete len:255 (+) comp7982_c1_seq1:45-809(+)